MKNIYQTLNEGLLNKYFLFESKQDEQNLIDFAGEEIAKKFLDLRKKLKSPENDLYYWIKNKTPEELKSFVDNYQSNRDTKSSNKTSGAKLVFNKNGDKIYFVTTYDAMKFYGKGTKWCVAGNYAGNESKGQEYFDDYLESVGSSGYYVIITPHTKVCVLVIDDNVSNTASIWNAEDDELSVLEFPDYVNQETMEFFGFNNCIHWDGKNSLKGNNNITEVIIDDGVTTIPDNAFSECRRLQSIEIPNSVTRIGYRAFYNCSSLARIKIPNSVTRIDDNAFEECSSLQSIEIPNSVTRIGEKTFFECKSLKSIEIPDSVTSIGMLAFFSCKSLQSIVIPNSVVSIDFSAFSYCSSLARIKIPNSVTNIDNGVFSGCKSLSDVVFSGTKQQFNKIVVGENNEYFLNANIHFNS